MPNKAHIDIIGHLGQDAKTKEVGSTTVTEFRLAVNHKSKNEETTMWFSCGLWGKRGQTVEQYLTKGKSVNVVGRFHVRTWTKDEVEHYSLEINADEVVLLGGQHESTREDQSDIPF